MCFSLIYDVGIEVNIELVMLVLGLVGGGEGFSEGREVYDFVIMYLGVVLVEGGLLFLVLIVD